ncbi:uncharacterized protein LOC132025395 [Mustela nigripes]|uniref:uncharacterized protein LOC132025395 n=1 Tax=Mustela nigripes TaxID=77151 RepID=UPI00281604E8|nr:uncharacterized protein LOC132025395 [Mustela nigripes]
MKRDVRATERPVTQRSCPINTSCSPRTDTHTHTHTHTHTPARKRAHARAVQTSQRLERSKNSSPCAAPPTRPQDLRSRRPGSMLTGVCCTLIPLSINIFYPDSIPEELDACPREQSQQTGTSPGLQARRSLPPPRTRPRARSGHRIPDNAL